MTNELIPSVSIEATLAKRDALLARAQTMIEEIRKLSEIGKDCHAGSWSDWFFEKDRYNHGSDPAPIDQIRRNIDRSIWRYLMNQSGNLSFMNKTAVDEWNHQLEKGEVPELNLENVFATFRGIHNRREEMFEKGILYIARKMSPSHKTNRMHKLGKKLILGYVVSYCRIYQGFSLHYDRRGFLDDLDRVAHIIDRKPERDHRQSVSSEIYAAMAKDKRRTHYEDDYWVMKWHKSGTLHVTFKRLDILDAMNQIIGKHYPDALAA